MSVSDTYILAISLARELGMTLAYSYLPPLLLVPPGVVQSGSSQAPPTLHLLSAHAVITIFSLGFLYRLSPHHSLPVWPSTHSSSMSPALAAQWHPPSASVPSACSPLCLCSCSFSRLYFFFSKFHHFFEVWWKLAFSVVPESENKQVAHFLMVAVFSVATLPATLEVFLGV